MTIGCMLHTKMARVVKSLFDWPQSESQTAQVAVKNGHKEELVALFFQSL